MDHDEQVVAQDPVVASPAPLDESAEPARPTPVADAASGGSDPQAAAELHAGMYDDSWRETMTNAAGAAGVAAKPEESEASGWLNYGLDAAATAYDTTHEMIAKLGAEATPVGALAAGAVHVGKSMYDVVTGDDYGAVKEGTEAAGAMMGAIPGVGVLDAGIGAVVSGGSGSPTPQTLSEIAGEKVADKVVGKDAQPAQVSTGGKIGAVVGGLLGGVVAPMWGPIGAGAAPLLGAEAGRWLGNQVDPPTPAAAPTAAAAAPVAPANSAMPESTPQRRAEDAAHEAQYFQQRQETNDARYRAWLQGGQQGPAPVPN